MRATYDKKLNLGYVYFTDIEDGGVKTTVACLSSNNSMVNFDLDGSGKLLGVEFIGAEILLKKGYPAGEQGEVSIEIEHDHKAGESSFFFNDLAKGVIAETVPCLSDMEEEGFKLIVDANAYPLGFKVLDASKRLPKKILSSDRLDIPLILR